LKIDKENKSILNKQKKIIKVEHFRVEKLKKNWLRKSHKLIKLINKIIKNRLSKKTWEKNKSNLVKIKTSVHFLAAINLALSLHKWVFPKLKVKLVIIKNPFRNKKSNLN
jgi:hypothetical protein